MTDNTFRRSWSWQTIFGRHGSGTAHLFLYPREVRIFFDSFFLIFMRNLCTKSNASVHIKIGNPIFYKGFFVEPSAAELFVP